MAKGANGKGLNDVLKKLKAKFKPEKMILFGSRARGDYLKESDYDLLLISSFFLKYNFRERLQLAYGSLSHPFPADIICLTPEEYERKRHEIGIINIAAKEGIKVG
ncbi:MAG: nucleotidyltransferase domain-containing protein [Candidatus Micrarchaeota archaeon]|mgnify:CR=1 FL=1